MSDDDHLALLREIKLDAALRFNKPADEDPKEAYARKKLNEELDSELLRNLGSDASENLRAYGKVFFFAGVKAAYNLLLEDIKRGDGPADAVH